MQNGSGFSVDAELFDPDCAFCNHDEITHILKETPRFLLAADYAPLVEGHILIIPKSHYTCYGDVPGELDAELFALKAEVQHFFTRTCTVSPGVRRATTSSGVLMMRSLTGKKTFAAGTPGMDSTSTWKILRSRCSSRLRWSVT